MTREQLDHLTVAEQMTAGEVVTMAVERFYQERKHAMIPQHIKVEYSDDSLFGHVDPDDEGIDASTSRAQFEEALVNLFYDEFPWCEVEFSRGINDRHVVDGHEDTEIAATVGQMIEKVWSSWDWLEYTEELDEETDPIAVL